ncbi:MAG: hypothetical protein ABJC55_03575 [Algoriphagus sp.]
MNVKPIYSLALLAAIFSCTESQKEPYKFQVSDLEPHIIKLASDEFEGRMPFSEGETKTINYLESEFKSLGLEPGNGNSYFQDVPLVSINSTASSEMTIKSPTNSVVLEGLKDYVIWTQRTEAEVAFEDAEIVFAGFGIVAPEYGWDDYKNIDVTGK